MEKRQALIRQLDTSLRDMRAEMPRPNPNYDPAKKWKRKHLTFTKELAEKERGEFETRLKQ